ncbi:hypothetical protein LB515_24355 [Mesorhizobium sp. CA15]|uniref:HTH domain-containing protein n=1 Tax=Mesorhizobium sp. CA15 TaxID=2876641 RepID=UPI001CD0AB43|nr:hypothetical protein [Mesorhizobium sp. CA15]MBZ9868516.1 hypothetical protein [Mesorhizobium sp. CA15]
MAGYKSTQISKPANEVEFEENCVVLFKAILKDPNVERLGTRGQIQDGVDIVGHRDCDPKKIVGIQCKLKSGNAKLTKKEVTDEIKVALEYDPPLSEYFIVSTSKNDTRLTQLAQHIMQEQAASGRVVQIEIWGWDTLQENIRQHEAAQSAFDPGFSPSIESQNRKLDILIAGQENQASHEQVAALAKSIDRLGADTQARLPAKYADRELKEGLSKILQLRGFQIANVAGALADLADRVISGDLSLGANTIRAEVCDRAARANATADRLVDAKRYRTFAAELDPTRDLFITDALLKGAEGDPSATLRELKLRSDPETRSTLLTAIVQQLGAASALQWVRLERIGPADLTAAGAVSLVVTEIDESDFEAAFDHVAEVPEAYFHECPVLHLLRAQLTLASILPADQKGALFQGLPLDPKSLRLASGPKGEDRIKEADADIRSLLAQTDELGLEELGNLLREFDLWLRLEGSQTRDEALKQLSAEISDPNKTLHRVRLALAYDVSFNQDALSRHLLARKELGGWTADERFAAFLMAYHSHDPRKIREFFEKHHDDLFAQTDLVRSALAAIEIEIFARTGSLDDARRLIALHRGPHLNGDQARDLEELVDHIEKGDEVESLRHRYAESKSLPNLRFLLAAIRVRGEAKLLAEYAPILAKETKSQEDFDLAIKSLFRSERYAEVVAIAEELPDLFALDDEYAAIKGWSLFQLGSIVEARTIARELLTRRKVAGDRELAINTAIETGDWGNLQAILAQEASRADALPTHDLLRLARLALEAGSPYVDHFRDEALRKAPDDPQVNLAAYLLATGRGEEYKGSKPREWFQKAVDHSGSEGPVQRMSIKEVIDRAPGWEEHTEKIDQLVRHAEIPLFIAAKGVRRQLLDLTLGQALRNSDPYDLRINYPVFAFSGSRPRYDLTLAKTVAFDITALITLDYLGLAEEALAFVHRPIIAPKTLSMLFIDRQFLKVQQPSEMAKARRIQALIASGRVTVVADSNGDRAAAKEIGRDLAALLSVAQRDGGLVVRSAPVAKLGTFLEDTADMTSHRSVLTDTLSVLSFLSGSGNLDAETKRAAEAYLTHVDVGWETPQTITPQSTLYLDDLAVVYLDYVGLLDVLTRSVKAVFVHVDLDTRTRETLQHGKHVDDLLSAIERIRANVSTGVEAGRLTFSARHRIDNGNDEEHERDETFDSSPTLDLVADLSQIEVVLSDDRCLNKRPAWVDSSKRSAYSASTLDILAALKDSGRIDAQVYWRSRHRLREAGYYAVPFEADELLHHLAAAPAVVDGKIAETPELKALSKSLTLPQINSAFVPEEVLWLISARFAACSAIREIWSKADDIDRAEACANWLISFLPDPLEWCVEPGNELAWAASRQQLAVQSGLMMIFVSGTRQRRRRYFEWLDKALIEPLRHNHPEIWDEVLDFLKAHLVRLAEVDEDEP